MQVGDIIPLKEFVLYKMTPPYCFSCKIDVMCVASLLQNRAEILFLFEVCFTFFLNWAVKPPECLP